MHIILVMGTWTGVHLKRKMVSCAILPSVTDFTSFPSVSPTKCIKKRAFSRLGHERYFLVFGLRSPTTNEAVPLPRIRRLTERTLNLQRVPGGGLSNVKQYKKPAIRPEPILNPPPIAEEILPANDLLTAELTELLYHTARSGMITDKNENVPPWDVFQATLTSSKHLQVSNVAFNQIIMAPPTNCNTIYTLLLRLKEAASALCFPHMPVCFDMGLLTKVLEMTWAKPEKFKDVLPCEGGMHLLMSIFCGIGYLYRDAGLKNLLHESGVFAPGTVNQMLSGTDFDRALYGLKLVEEVLAKRFLIQFKVWCIDNGKTIPP